MIYQKYFKAGQRVQLRAINPLPPEGRNELLRATIENVAADYFDLRLPYGPESVTQYPFSEERLFELSADTLGMGIKVSVSYLKPLSGQQIRVQVLPDLQMFQRRILPRLDCSIGIRFTRGKKSLLNLRETWEKNAALLSGSKKTASLQGFKPCQLNLCPGGVRFTLQPPAKPGDICLMLLDLSDNKAPICALAEIIWVSAKDEQGTLQAGMQFIDILEQDQTRIAQFIRKHS